MTTYVDSSVALRIVLGARGALSGWQAIDHPIASALIEVECLRTLDRLRLVDKIAAEEIAVRRATIYDFVGRIDLVDVTSIVLARASQPLPVPLRTLDAIHLATALIWSETEQDAIVVATHDEALALAARTVGLEVIGV